MLRATIEQSVKELQTVQNKFPNATKLFRQWCGYPDNQEVSFVDQMYAFDRYNRSLGYIVRSEDNTITDRMDIFVTKGSDPTNIGDHNYSIINPYVRAMDVIFLIIENEFHTRKE